MTKALILARFSPDADESTSNEKQRCREYCRLKGYEVVKVFEEVEMSGGGRDYELDPSDAVIRRPILFDALDALEKGYVLVVRWRSRLARNVYLSEYCHRRAAKVGARIEAADVSNGENPEDELKRQILDDFREYESQIINMTTRRGVLKKQAGGYRMGRADRIPWGTSLDPNDDTRLVPNEEELEVTEMIRGLRAGGLSFRTIARWLETHGIKRRGADTWDHSRVKKILMRAEAIQPQ